MELKGVVYCSPKPVRINMPYCPKCENKLTKRKSDMAYHCKRHGFVRKINTVGMVTKGISDSLFVVKPNKGDTGS